MKIKELMSHPAITCPAGDTMENAARLMWEFDCGIIPVVNDDGRLGGVITDRDICMAAYTQGRPLRTIPIASGMAKAPVAVHANDSIESAEDLMRDNQIRRLPVLDDNGRPVGVLSLNDLARLTARAKHSQAERKLVETLAATCEPRPTNGHAPLTKFGG
jgi:CBS domain-containing protein